MGGITLLDNFVIDNTLQLWAKVIPYFKPYNFNMIDYEKYSFKNGRVANSPDTLQTENVATHYKNGARCVACIINTDTYHGNGKHWMALFVDMREPVCTIEFFNSSGRENVNVEWRHWMNKTEGELRGIGLQTKQIFVLKEHQYSETECGVYSLFYIWARLNRVSAKHFMQNRIPDKAMYEFRQRLFNDPHMKEYFDKTGGQFVWDVYVQMFNPY